MNRSFLKRRNRFCLLLNLLLLVSVSLHAGEPNYSVLFIPPALLKEANVIKRMDVTEYEVINAQEAVLRHRFAYTVLNKDGARFASLKVFYSSLIKPGNVEGALYAANGNLIRKVKGREVQDFSAVDDISLIDDNRVKIHDFDHHTYPYTVEYETELHFKTTYYVPRWYPQNASRMSVEQSSFVFTAPADYEIRYQAFQYSAAPVISNEKGKKKYTWEVKNLAAVQPRFAAPLWHELTPVVLFSPSKFWIQGYEGNASSWQELGKLYASLNAGREALPESIVQKVKGLTANVQDPKEKVKLVFEYMQQNTRYISIQLGIGGLQPFEASFVAQKGYGDCKALSNYMYSMLKAAGIRSYWALINGGRSEDDRFLVESLPSHQFNHMVLCVPLAKDSVWLECTSQTAPAGYMGSFTGNRKALLITENGGKLVTTPRYGVAENLQLRKISATMDAEGSFSMKVNTRYMGTQQDEYAAMISSETNEELKKELQTRFEMGTYEVQNFKYDWKKSTLPVLYEDLELVARNYATISGRRIFILPNIMNKQGRRLSFDSTRKVDFVFGNEFRDEDEVEIQIPEGYELEAPLKEVTLNTPYGFYSVQSKLDGNKITYKRVWEQKRGRYTVKEQAAIIQFYEEMYKSDRSKIVLVRKAS